MKKKIWNVLVYESRVDKSGFLNWMFFWVNGFQMGARCACLWRWDEKKTCRLETGFPPASCQNSHPPTNSETLQNRVLVLESSHLQSVCIFKEQNQSWEFGGGIFASRHESIFVLPLQKNHSASIPKNV